MYRQIPFISGSGVVVQFILGYGFRFLGSVGLLFFTRQLKPMKTLAISIITISVTTLLISLLPNHKHSFYVLIFLRALQSLAFAVEFPTGASIFKEDVKTASVVSAATQGYILSSLVCAVIFHFCSPEQTALFGWRIPFLLGGVIGTILSVLRFKNLAEIQSYEPPLHNNNKINLISLKNLRTVVKFTVYVILLKYAITHSMAQSYIISSTPKLATMHTISLIFSAFFAYFANYTIRIGDLNIKLYDLAILFAIGLNLTHLNPTNSVMLTFILNQLFVTSFMIKSLIYAKELFSKAKYLIPPIYNFITLIASVLFHKVVLSNPDLLLTLTSFMY